MYLTNVLNPAWASLILIFCLVNQSDQTTQNDFESSIERLQDLLLGKWADLAYKISSIDDRLKQVDTLIKNDIRPKLESMEATVNQIETSQRPMLIEMKQKVESIESEVSALGKCPSIDNVLDGPINELKSQGNSINAAINTLTSNTLSMSKNVDNIGNELQKGIESMKLPFEELKYQGNATLQELKMFKQVSESCSSAVNNITDEFNESIISVINPLNDIKAQTNKTLYEIKLLRKDYPTINEISLKIDSTKASLNKSEENSKKLLECKPSSGISMEDLPWHEVNNERFVRFADKMTWHSARILCQNNCLDLLKPNDAIEVAKYLKEKFSDAYYWLAGHGDAGNLLVWVTTGEAINKTEPWYGSAYGYVNTDTCLRVITYGSYPEAGTVLGTRSCTANNSVLCG